VPAIRISLLVKTCMFERNAVVKSGRRLYWLAGLLLVAVAVLGYRLWRVHDLRRRLTSARVHLERGDPSMSLFVLRPSLAAGRRDGELLLLAAKSYRLLGDSEKALGYLGEAASVGYESAETDLEHGLALFELGRIQEAELLLRQSPTKEAAAALADLHLQIFEMDKVLGDLENWIKLDPQNPFPFLVRGDLWVQASDHEKAAGEFRRAIELSPDYFDAHLRLGTTLIELGRLDEAAESLANCQKLQPHDVHAKFQLARCRSELGEVTEARTLFEQVIELHRHYAPALVALGKIELDDDNSRRATELLTRAVAADRHNESAWYNLAIALRRQDRHEDAATASSNWNKIMEARSKLRELTDRIQTDPSDISAHAEAGKQCEALGDSPLAIRHFTTVLAQDPTNAEARDALRQLGVAIPRATAGTTAPASPTGGNP